MTSSIARALPFLNRSRHVTTSLARSFSINTSFRSFSTTRFTLTLLTPPKDANEGEAYLFKKLVDGMKPTQLEVVDVSGNINVPFYKDLKRLFRNTNIPFSIKGGCGSMYAVKIASPKFKGVPLVKQHRMVQDLLKDDIAKMHGIQIKTEAPKE